MNLVFGDLQEENALYLLDKCRAMLADFDGVDRDGPGVRYSVDLNPEVGLGAITKNRKMSRILRRYDPALWSTVTPGPVFWR